MEQRTETSGGVPAGTNPLTIVGIGASAGGIEAFREFFEAMPPDTGMAFVVILHLPAARKSLLPEILGRWTAMPVVEATEGCAVEANHVYVPPAGVGITLHGGRLHPHRPTADEPREFTPIDRFFDSLAAAQQEDAIGIVLSGTGSDGALGLKAIRAHGGLTLAQGVDGTAPLHGGMPASAIATGAVDIVAPVETMPAHIIGVQEARIAPGALAGLSAAQSDAARLAICAALRRQIGHDFSGYKDKTFMRRVQRRMQVLGVATIDAYVASLENDRTEAPLLFRDLLIGVTGFFRDASTFEALKDMVIPRLFEGKVAGDTVRLWVAGCASGEEAYSLAILLREHAAGLGGTAPIMQVFATDIDETAISIARTGRYPATLLRAVSPERLSRFFVEGADGSFTVTKEVRELCTFSAHSLTRDPPFSRLDMVSCRNLLIYLDVDLQAAVLPAFHYALVPNGILLLGSSETVSRHEDLFATIDRPNRIFQRRNVPSPPLQLRGRMPAIDAVSFGQRAVPATGGPLERPFKMSGRASTRILERFAPAFVVVNADGGVVEYSSRIGRFLEPAPGSPSQNVLTMCRRGLRAHLSAALKQVVLTGRAVEKPGVAVTGAGETRRRITLAVEPIIEPGSDALYLIVFIEAAPPAGSPPILAETGNSDADRQIDAELKDTRERLQSLTEEHETAVEELRSSNEELHSVNEELQSTNEELETSKEEIQSVNEELQTVNAQLAGKVTELDDKNIDLKNLFESTQVATIFLDTYLVVRSFTPAVASIYNLIPSDVGRPLTDIVSRLRYSGLRDDIRHVLANLEPLERRVMRDDDATHYLMRILPYRAPDSTVDGTLITFVDVTRIVQAEQHQRLLVDELNHRVRNMLTVVTSLASQTMRRSTSLVEFSENYLGRLQALTAAYALLSKENWRAVSLRDVVMEELRPFLAGDHTDATVDGPAVTLNPQAALALGMAIHELTTNAVKYGALSVPDGQLNVVWRVEHAAAGDQLVLEWAERGGPPVVTPTHRGFGMTLIERGLKQDMGAQVDVEFAETGVRACLRAPLSAPAPAPDADGSAAVP